MYCCRVLRNSATGGQSRIIQCFWLKILWIDKGFSLYSATGKEQRSPWYFGCVLSLIELWETEDCSLQLMRSERDVRWQRACDARPSPPTGVTGSTTVAQWWKRYGVADQQTLSAQPHQHEISHAQPHLIIITHHQQHQQASKVAQGTRRAACGDFKTLSTLRGGR